MRWSGALVCGAALGVLFDVGLAGATEQDGAAWIKGLPAVSEDGKWVAAALRVSDGARANDNLALGIFQVERDRLVSRVTVVDAVDPDKAGGSAREAQATDLLAKHRWRPLSILTLRENSVAVGEGLRVTYREPVLTVREISGRGRILLRRTAKGFSMKGGPRCRGCGHCPAPIAKLAAAYVDRTVRVLFVEIRYEGGTDTCWEPDETFHVVSF